ncbi:DUF885 domain-containing protein [Parasphingorhabdus cellanae]|uniref:DUF885 domain-containing protein n=1 Tax=Parasphingorhabdus cellanae TaxID=2806553 RepID=A0ABX7SZJ3_9SPHN|nr:DUF885 domain-containing protein [Parasphingorhabdus cellanae]QTD54694.1 DUF885 domain-containing protein [Parasphingorhabdus cellanae]
MTKYVLLTTTAFLAACSPTDGEVVSASANPAQAQTEQAEADSDINARLSTFFDDYDQIELANSPISKSYRGIKDMDYGKLDDPSDAAAVEQYERGQEALVVMEAEFDESQLSDDSKLSYRLFQARAERSKNAFPFRRNSYIFDQMNGAQSQIPAFMINIHRVTNKADAEAYVSRLNAAGPFFDSLVAQSAERANDGIIVPDWVFPYVINDAKNVISGAPFDEGEDSPIYADLQKKVNALSIPDAEKADLIARGRTALTDSLAPAYKSLIAEMERQQTMAVDGDGVWRFKDGAAYYAERLKNYTTTDLTADEIHQIGLDNVERIHGEMRKIMAQVGFEGSLQDFFEHLRTSDQYFHTSREDYLAEANLKLAAMEKELPKFFNTLPKAPFVIKPVEAFREKSAGKAFYQRPAPDGSRPGTYYVNLYDLKGMSKTELEALAYHEALPGHHLQLAIQTELGDLPAFRKFGGITAYSEGWGLYTEELGKDMGFYTDPYSDFGRLGMELWRACRLVVDTGIHDKRWSREKAIKYLTDNTPNPDSDIRKAIERYIVYPGQATAYMIGKLKIMELREKSQKELGDKFTMGDFHDVILRSGPVPLNIMEERVNSWIAANR